MLKTMRDNMPLVMWILVISFLATIIFSWGMGGFSSGTGLDGVVGRIGNFEVMYDQYNQKVQDKLARMRQDDPTMEITDDKVREARNEIWNDLVRTQLMEQYQNKFGIVTSDNEVAFAVRNNPPNYIRENENFQTDGRFDPALYEEFLRDPNSVDILISIEQDYRTSISNQKVIDRIISPVYVTPNEVWDDFVARNAKFRAVVVSFPFNNYPADSSRVTDADTRSYYDSQKDDYRTPEKRMLSYVTIPIVRSRSDSERVISLANDILSWAREGQDFVELAQEYSEDQGSASNGGDLGWFTRGRMVAEFDSVAFGSEAGSIVGPVLTRFGAHIIDVEETAIGGEQDSVKARHILIKWDIGADTDARAAQKARDFADAAKLDGFEATAEKFDLELARTAEFPYDRNGNITGIGRQLPVMEFAYQSKVGAISSAHRITIRGQEGYSVFQLEKIIPKGFSPYETVLSSIQSKLIVDTRLAASRQAAEQFKNTLPAPDDLVSAALAESLKVDTSGTHARRDFLRPFGQDEQIAKTLLELPIGQLSPVLSNNRGAYVARVIAKVEADSSVYLIQKDQLKTNLLRTKQNRVYSDWLAMARKEIGVTDNRYLYYTDF